MAEPCVYRAAKGDVYFKICRKRADPIGGWQHQSEQRDSIDFVIFYFVILISISKISRKLLLNSLWGKLCQRSNPSHVVITKSPQEFHRTLDNTKYEVLDAVHLNKRLDRIVYRHREEFAQAPDTNCVPLTVFVTSHGRRRLYQCMMEAVFKGLKLVYCDTDSLVLKRDLAQTGIVEGQIFNIKI